MRDRNLEATLRSDLADRPGITETGMFGGWAFLVNGHLLCGARHDGMLARLGRGNDAWILSLPGATPLFSGQRPMPGWVRLPPDLCADDALRRRVLDAALRFAGSLPPR